MQRRTVLASLGTAAVGGIAFATTTDTSKASVTFGDLSIPDTNKSIDGDIGDITFAVDANYEYDATEQPDETLVQLQLGNASNQTPVGGQIDPSPPQKDSGTQHIEASLFNSSQWSQSDFAIPNAGDSVTQTVVAKLVFEVSKDGSPVATAEAQTTVSITVTHQTIQVSVDVGGSGGVTVTSA